MSNYLEQIIKFNSDKEIIALREKYKEPTFFEIISKQRSETTYSSFLKWMFQSSRTDLNTVSPILLLLDVLVKRGNNQINDEGNNIIDESLKNIIVTRNFKLNNIDVEAEKSVKVLAQECIGRQKTNILSDDDLKQIASKCQDRIDLFINCDIEIDNKSMQLQVIIENKIDSIQGGGKDGKSGIDLYEKASQTDRYYMATARNSEDLKQVYVYLLPESSDYTKDRIKKDKHKVNANFIEIYYQDIVDDIVIPMLSSTTLSARERFFLEELRTELTFPSLEGDNVKNNIASSKENVEAFTRLWKDYSELITNAAIATSECDIYLFNNRYYNNNPNAEDLIKACIDKDLNLTKEKGLISLDKKDKSKIIKHANSTYYYNIKKNNGEFISFVKELNITLPERIEIKEDFNLLTSFWENNKRFLLAFMNGLEDKEHQRIECLTQEASKRTSTKYRVFYKNECLNELYLNEKDKGSNNSETAWLIIKAWVEKKRQNSISFEELRQIFNPENCNPYYSSGRYFSNLFYIFNKNGLYIADGSKNFKDKEVLAGGWDFYKPKDIDNDKKFRIQTSDGEVIMLKMWRKDGLKKLKNLVENPDNGYFEKDELSIIDLSSQQSE